MANLSESLSHPAWQGVGALATIVGLLLGACSLYIALTQPGTRQQPDSAYSQNANNNTKDAGSDTSAGLVNSGISSVDESSTGIHKYFNDWKPAAFLSVILILGGLIASSRGRRSEGTKT